MKKSGIILLTAISFVLSTSVLANPPQGMPPNHNMPPHEQQMPKQKIQNSELPSKIYEKVTDEPKICAALDVMEGTVGEFSRNAILGENLTEKPIKIEFMELSTVKPQYANYDALGMKKGKQLYIYINTKHYNAPVEAIAALLSHEALHQDEFNSISEETYAWTMEATVWADLCRKNPQLRNEKTSSLATRENLLLKMLENANYSNALIKNTVVNHPGYQALPAKSPGFD